MPTVVPDSVQQETVKAVVENVFPWPRILNEPTPERADGRFVKAFPLAFPMGVGDLYQTRVRNDFHEVDAIQHLLRYESGHVHNVNDGHRLEYALFNTALRRIARDKGGIVHKNTNQTVLTKQLDLCETQAHLVHRVASFGAEIPTTSMFWKREARHLEWIVRQMSWRPPWTPRSAQSFLEEHPMVKFERNPPFLRKRLLPRFNKRITNLLFPMMRLKIRRRPKKV